MSVLILVMTPCVAFGLVGLDGNSVWSLRLVLPCLQCPDVEHGVILTRNGSGVISLMLTVYESTCCVDFAVYHP